MKYTVPILKQLLANNNIKSSTMNKFEMLQTLIDANILKKEDVFPPKVEKKRTAKETRPPKQIDPKHEYLRFIRTQPKRVTCRNVTNGDITVYKSIYKASKSTGHGPSFFSRNHGKIVGDYIFYVH